MYPNGCKRCPRPKHSVRAGVKAPSPARAEPFKASRSRFNDRHEIERLRKRQSHSEAVQQDRLHFPAGEVMSRYLERLPFGIQMNLADRFLVHHAECRSWLIHEIREAGRVQAPMKRARLFAQIPN